MDAATVSDTLREGVMVALKLGGPLLILSMAVGILVAIFQAVTQIHEQSLSFILKLIVVVVVVGGFFGYKYLISGPRAEKAAAMMFVAEQQFAVDSFALALNGDGNFAGFLEVIDRYGSTDEGNLARHYAGICYLRLGEYQQALDYLKEYSASTKSVPEALLAAQNCGLQGDAYAQLENYAEAVRMYEKAVAASDNSLSAPYYLKKAGGVYEKLGDYAKALAAYERISDDYPASMEARDIQKYIGRIQQQM